MSMPSPTKPPADLRDDLAEERTFLAWIRTGLTLMGFGFVVARFGLFLEVMQINRAVPVVQSHGFSRWVGTAFVAGGVATTLFSVRRHFRLVGEFSRGQLVRPSSVAYGRHSGRLRDACRRGDGTVRQSGVTKGCRRRMISDTLTAPNLEQSATRRSSIGQSSTP